MEIAPGLLADRQVQDPGFDTTGQKFLRLYQLTDAGGTKPGYTPWVALDVMLRDDPCRLNGVALQARLQIR